MLHLQLSQCDGGKTARYCGIYSEVPLDKPALGVSKACGTGLQAIITSAVVSSANGGLKEVKLYLLLKIYEHIFVK